MVSGGWSGILREAGFKEASMGSIQGQLDAIVIGGGGLGTATAFHLVKAGLSVALIDRVGFASQTSARAAGLSGQLRPDDAMTRIAAPGGPQTEKVEEEP